MDFVLSVHCQGIVCLTPPLGAKVGKISPKILETNPLVVSGRESRGAWILGLTGGPDAAEVSSNVELRVVASP